MEKSFWGPSVWCSIHSIAAGYKPENIVSIKQFTYSLPYLLPCKYCCMHLGQNLQLMPLTNQALQDNRSLFLWSYLLHDLVNMQLKKKTSPNYTAVEQQYFNHLGNNKFWGPCIWRTIHAFAATYTPAAKNAFTQFVYSLTGVLPCNECRSHFIHNLNQIPLDEKYLENAHTLFLWSYLFHDLVNKQLGKVSPPFETIKEQYFNSQVCDSCGK